MTIILCISLAVAVAFYVGVAKASREGPRKAKKQEKAEIMRQLLALSDLENNISAAAPPLRSATPRTGQRRQSDKRSARRRGCAVP